MPKFAQYDPTAQQPAPVLGWYDTDIMSYRSMPSSAELLALTDAQWATRFDTPYVQNGTLVAVSAPTLAEAQVAKIAELTDDCQATILGGYTSSALGAVYTYPSKPTDQQNMIASVLASLLPGVSADWTTPFWCADTSGNWAMRLHTPAQIQQVGADGKTHVQLAQVKLANLNAQVMAATTVSEVQAIIW